MNNETNKTNKCRVCDGELATASEQANGICVPCYCQQQDALLVSTAPKNASDAAAVPSDANLKGADCIPPGTLDAMLKVGRKVKNANAKRDVWIDRAYKAEMRVKELSDTVIYLQEANRKLDIALEAEKKRLVIAGITLLVVCVWLVGSSLYRIFFAT